MPPAFRPTRLQLIVPHSPVIDWLPWPDLRDLLIQVQEQVDIDTVCRYAILCMVAHRKKAGFMSTRDYRKTVGSIEDGYGEDRVQNFEVVDGSISFRVWDLTLLESSHGSSPSSANRSLLKTRPLPQSPSMRSLQRAYNLVYDDFSTQKLEDRFFERYPVLYRENLMSEFKTQSISSVAYEDPGMPVEMTRDAVFRLKAKVQDIIGETIEI